MEKAIYFDIELCVGCGACVVACMDENDLYPEKGQPALRRICRIEDGEFPDARIRYLPAACMHCQDSPCVIACPTGAVSRDDRTGAVTVNRELCIGCHSCALACPFGVPRYDQEERMQKCNFCIKRVEAGLEPACVRVCPTGSLKFDSLNHLQQAKESKYAVNIVRALHKTAVEK